MTGPALEEGLDILRSELIADLLEPCGVLTGQETVVQTLKANALPAQLLLDPLVAIEAELDRIGQIGTDFEKRWTPVAVLDIEIEVVDEDGLAAELEADAS